MIEQLLYWDSNILLFIQEHMQNSILTPIFIFFTNLGNAGIIWILLSVLLLFFKKTRKIGCIGIYALILSFLVNNVVLKNLVARSRPFDTIKALTPLIPKPTDFSFPSGHTASSFSVACVFYRKLPPKFGIPALILAVLISFSRLYVGVHYPSDVVVGMISGIVISYLAESFIVIIANKYKRMQNKRLEG